MIEEKLQPSIEHLFLDFKSLTQFYSAPRHFKQTKMSFEARDNLLNYFYKFIVAMKIRMTQESVKISKAEKFANI